MINFDLTGYETWWGYELSEGGLRKLCCAMAVLGSPRLILIDEVSTGLDPVSRKYLWEGMRKQSYNSVVLVTTHTMEETEALATKIGMMAQGRFRCIGTL